MQLRRLEKRVSLLNYFKNRKNPSRIGAVTGPIGFYLAKENLHMVQLEKHADGLWLRSGLSVRYPDDREALLSSPDDFKSLVKKSLKTGQFKGNEIVTSLPGGVKIINLTYQMEASQKIEDEIVKSIIFSLGGAPEDYIIDYLPIRSESLTSREKSVLAMVAPREKVIDFLDLLTGADLQVKAVDVGPASLGRLVSSLGHDKSYPYTLLINFAENKSYLSVFDGRRLIMDRELTLGLNNLLDILTKSLKIDKEQAMEMLTRYGFQTNKEDFNANGSGLHDQEIVDSIVEILKPSLSEVFVEVNKMLLFVKSETRGKKVEQIYLLGCIAHFPGVDHFFSEIFSLPAALIDPLAQITIDDRRTKHFGLDGQVHIALSVGFAMRGMI
jgi:Tfp pilus assembly PilM family ATPase